MVGSQNIRPHAYAYAPAISIQERWDAWHASCTAANAPHDRRISKIRSSSPEVVLDREGLKGQGCALLQIPSCLNVGQGLTREVC
jgi:hypothetical protein